METPVIWDGIALIMTSATYYGDIPLWNLHYWNVIWHLQRLHILPMMVLVWLNIRQNCVARGISFALSTEGRTLQWRHNECDGISNHHRLDCFCSTVCSGADQTKHQSSASLAFVRGIRRRIVDSPYKEPVTRKIFLFDDVIMRCLINVRSLFERSKPIFDCLRSVYGASVNQSNSMQCVSATGETGHP